MRPVLFCLPEEGGRFPWGACRRAADRGTAVVVRTRVGGSASVRRVGRDRAGVGSSCASPSVVAAQDRRQCSQAAYRIGPKSADERQDRKTPQLKRFSQETDKVHMGAWATMRPHVDTGRPLRIGRSCSGCRLREPARSGKGRGVGCRGFRFDDRRGVLPCRPWSRRGPSWIASSDVRASTAVLSWGIQWFTAYLRSVVRILFWCLIYMDISLVGCVFTASI